MGLFHLQRHKAITIFRIWLYLRWDLAVESVSCPERQYLRQMCNHTATGLRNGWWDRYQSLTTDPRIYSPSRTLFQSLVTGGISSISCLTCINDPLCSGWEWHLWYTSKTPIFYTKSRSMNEITVYCNVQTRLSSADKVTSITVWFHCKTEDMIPEPETSRVYVR